MEDAETNALVTYTAGGIPAILTMPIPKDGMGQVGSRRRGFGSEKGKEGGS